MKGQGGPELPGLECEECIQVFLRVGILSLKDTHAVLRVGQCWYRYAVQCFPSMRICSFEGGSCSPLTHSGVITFPHVERSLTGICSREGPCGAFPHCQELDAWSDVVDMLLNMTWDVVLVGTDDILVASDAIVVQAILGLKKRLKGPMLWRRIEAIPCWSTGRWFSR